MKSAVCELCSEFKNGKCLECFGQSIKDIDSCPLGCDDTTLAEMEETEKSAKTINRYTTTEKTKKKPTKERKVDNEKLMILESLVPTLEQLGFENITRETETCLHFDNYTLKLTRHRKKK